MNKYLEKAASIMKLPVRNVKGLGGVVRSAKSFAGKENFGFKSSAKTPMIDRLKGALH